jgi:hypothetical protein
LGPSQSGRECPFLVASGEVEVDRTGRATKRCGSSKHGMASTSHSNCVASVTSESREIYGWNTLHRRPQTPWLDCVASPSSYSMSPWAQDGGMGRGRGSAARDDDPGHMGDVKAEELAEVEGHCHALHVVAVRRHDRPGCVRHSSRPRS